MHDVAMKRILARFIAIVTAVGVLATPGTSSGLPQPCVRAIGIDQQVTAGEGTGVLTFTVHSGGCAAPGVVAYAVTSGSAQLNEDFLLANGNLQWAAGDTSDRQIVATLVSDGSLEPYLEDFTVDLVLPSPTIDVAISQGQGRIADDDAPALVWVGDNVVCPPGGVIPHDVHGESGNCGVKAVANKLQANPVTVHWKTNNGTAIAGTHYVGVTTGIQTLPPGATSVTLNVKLLTTAPGTANLWFTVEITAVSRGRIIDSIAVVTISGS
jgi:chitinase